MFRGVESDPSMPEFETSVVSWSGEQVRSAYEVVSKNQGRIGDLGVPVNETYSDAAHQAIIQADKLYTSGDTEQADFNIEFAKQLSGAGAFLSPYHGEGKLWHQAIHSANPDGTFISNEARTASTYDLSRKILAGGALQSHSMHQSAKNLASRPNPFTPRIIQGGGEAIKAANVWSRLGPLMSTAGRVLNIGLTALSLGGDTRLDANGVPVTPAYQIGTISAEELNDSRITHRSPRPGESPARWHQYLTGTGVYDSQQGLIDENDSDLAMGLLESGFRDPKQIEEVVNSANKAGLDGSDVKPFAEVLEKVGQTTVKNTPDEIAQAYKVGKNGGHLKNQLSDIASHIDDVGHRRSHILNRHKAGTGKTGKTEYPSNWDDNRIMHNVSEVAKDPGAIRGSTRYGEYAVGYRDGMLIRVDFYPNNHATYPGKISTAYPINVKPNP